MSNILAKIFGNTGAGIADKLSGIVDKFVHTKEEKAQFKKEMDQIWINAEADMQKNVTERWGMDSQIHSSWLAKNVRPLTLLITISLTLLMIFIDSGSIKFNVDDEWKSLLQLVLITIIGAYFGGRSFEKVKNNGS
jgi:cation transport ATPase